MGKPTLLVDVMGYPHDCDRCRTTQQWVWAVEARALSRDGTVEAVATDQELPVQIARVKYSPPADSPRPQPCWDSAGNAAAASTPTSAATAATRHRGTPSKVS
ncbi:hypothetical protein ACIGO9_29750 [Nocardia asteroides]|uniref:hypothetical protein n=1 Tax=Nocardia asteroides TaxID=1824 RepID=UPI0037CA392F